MRHWIGSGLRFSVVLPVLLAPLFAEDSGLINILTRELARNYRILKEKADPPPYFIAYSVDDVQSHVISATLGSLLSSSNNRRRYLDVTVRVGSPKLDDYHVIDGRMPVFTSGMQIALEDNPNAIRQAVWRETDRVYRLGSQRLIKIRTDRQVRVADKQAVPDFSPETAAAVRILPPSLNFSTSEWTARMQRYSRVFADYPDLLTSRVSLVAQRQIKYFVDTEGSKITHGWTLARISISATAKAPDGMDVAATRSFEARLPQGLPPDRGVLAAIRKVAEQATKLVDAPPVNPYVAPAILSGRAAGVFFHEIFGHRVEGHRLKDPTEGHTFGDSLNKPVLPAFLSVYFDPTLTRIGNTDLMGWYDYDDEGVKARRVTVVDSGILKTFLTSRSPVKDIAHSNGHGRREPGREVISRQSNLVVESSRRVSGERLRAMLLEQIKRQNKQYGFYFDQVTGGYTLTGRRGIQAFKVIPLVVYRVYPDGRPDELVRGADIVGTPLAAFSKIIATGDEPAVFNGYCGAESGDVPVSASSPALLVSEIEIQRKESSQQRAPILPRPATAVGGAE